MSGGHFDFKQYQIRDIADSIERELNRQGKEKSINDLYMNEEYYKKYPEEKYYYKYPKEVQDQMKEAIKILKMAEIYVHRIDWLLSDDDGEETFLERLKEDLDNLKK